MTRIYLTEEGVQVSGEGLDHLLEAVTEEPWNKHIPGDPMPCKCGDSVVEVKFRNGAVCPALAGFWSGYAVDEYHYCEITDLR